MNMKTDRLRTLIMAGAMASSSLLGSTDARGALAEGATAPNATLEDADGRVSETRAFRGKPLLIVYEDRDSAKQNEALKKELGELARGDRYRARIALAAVADVSAWDFWPAKGFVKDAIRDESKKQGTTIYCDWSGAFRKAYDLRRGVSNVVLVGKDGRVLFTAEGTVPAASRKRLIAMLREQVEG
ncbi:Hypothetical protein A7982_08941 [Minicystis rosea]|nr:Hypothetical protein A7982_08941 [Minicystis rosea]